ncbi:outer membrane protein Imp [Klebsiella oxytoca]|nr:outer membrane protein Imp [Klebsiella oxytoca]
MPDHAKGNYPDNAVFTGNVDINQGNSRLQADEVQLHQQQAEGQPQPVRTVDALGNVHYDDNQVILKGPKAWSNLNTKRYQRLAGRLPNGRPSGARYR